MKRQVPVFIIISFISYDKESNFLKQQPFYNWMTFSLSFLAVILVWSEKALKKVNYISDKKLTSLKAMDSENFKI